MDSSQLLEKFRYISRDIQQCIQDSNKKIENISSRCSHGDLNSLNNNIQKISEYWYELSTWINLSTLDDLEEAKLNSAKGELNLKSKIIRTVNRFKKESKRKSLKIDYSGVQDLLLSSYISYFEIILDIAFQNAVKYSPNNQTITIYSSLEKNEKVHVFFESYGPIVESNEINKLTEKGFRGSNALNLTTVTGEGYGLYNLERLCSLLLIEPKFKSDKNSTNISGVLYSNFTLKLIIELDD